MSVPKYDVFLSFRGEDTRDNFVSHLDKELQRKKIETFIDYRIESGDEVSPALNKAIEESTIYVIILSEHYASSSWCLDELTEILKCKEKYGREVIPVFYKVDPSNVRHQRESYADDLVKHHQRNSGKVDVWKAALTQVANLSGLDSQKIRPESTLVEKIAEDILKKLNRPVSSDYCDAMTGIDMHIEQIQYLLLLESPTVRIIGIWGMGGIGKTTIATAIFEKLATQFSSRSIVLNVQQEIEKYGLDHVKSKYLSKLLGEDITSSEYNFSFDPRLKRMKVLLVFDDVKDSDQLQYLIGTHPNFGEGSRIIVTSRDRQVLENANADEIYQVRGMDYQDSLQLFHSFAFKQNRPLEETYVSLSKQVLDYAKGVPLALKVLGSLLYGRTKEAWESELQKLKKLPDHKIFSLLKLSYDGLDEEQKDIFLDIACFHRGHSEKHVALTLDSCGFSANIGMDVLKDRCLISISVGYVWMHDLIEEMGHEIVRLQCVDDPGKRSRLWKTNDIYDVLSKNKGTGAIKCISLDMREIDEEVQLDADTFKKMRHLRMINFYNGYRNNFNGFLKSFPDKLKFLHWDYFPQRSLPLDFCPRNLVTLEMFYSDLEQLWEGDQALPNLKRLDLYNSRKLTRLPDLSFCPKIEEVCLFGCISLTQVYSSSFLNNLYILTVEGCTELKSIDIPSNILSRPSGLVSLSNCYNLETLIISSRTYHVVQFTHSYRYYKFERIQFFFELNWGDFFDTVTATSNNDVYWLDTVTATSNNDVYRLDLSNCESLTSLPAELLNLKFLTRLHLSGCLKLEELPEIKETMENLKVLYLDETAIKELPSSLDRLVGLEELNLEGCSIVNLPESIAHLSSLRSLRLSDCKLLECVPKLPPNLNHVLAYDCPSIKRMMLNSRSDFKKGTFKFHLTNSEEVDGTCLSNIEEVAYIKINDDAYWSVLFCFPGSAIPDWFRHRCQGHSITIRRDDLYLYGRNRLIGFALCVVLGRDFPDRFSLFENFTYELKFESDGETHSHPNKFEVDLDWKTGQNRRFAQNHTFLWKYELDNGLIDADTITFEILDEHRCPLSFPTTMTVIECGICPLYAKENNDDSIEEPSGSGDAVCLVDLDLSLGGNYTHNKRRKT
ncbi:disease resistance protein RPV1-like isoform X4 [Trifolium pratense]|uniref:disease resistance protein RPV1-like isoform X4 n=1 Tax=Trifolium pratense TaxID=57577 RepID=UPI001E696910|nr:disease resistance protein RPV1-like isoform X4 [Trifolium pratense]